jgi:hypothetical protein
MLDPLGLLPADQGPNRFDRHQHDALPERGANEPVAFVKAGGGLVYCVRYDAPRAGDLRCRKASSQGVAQKRRSNTAAPPRRIDRQAPN